MGKLNIAHHKSYHPYRRDNIERVRKDEEEARLKESKEEGRMMLADAEARIDLLRQKAGVPPIGGSGSEQSKPKKRRRQDEEKEEMKRIAEGSGLQHGAILPTTNGHINLFEDLEHTQKTIAAAIRSSSKKASTASSSTETEKGVPLAPSTKDLNPWYSERNSSKDEAKELEDREKERKRREESRKTAHDPLTSITRQLAVRSSSLSSRTTMRPPPLPASSSGTGDVHTRLNRESSERERALALIRRKKREMEGNMTPSTVVDDSGSEYGDMYNRREVQEAHRYRERDVDRDVRDRYRERRDSGGRYDRRRWDDDDRDSRQRSRSTARW
ncbi:hypothetical protein CPB83DRAFT_855341 [Crepidotus variabilis]|uniref:CBF1-interacting co-repressor CIR N-terminal domain-containing protein n=1 Tax=Crepidotus variabilis TaxID=179855 RepID=A0A9P6EFM7_9AGAR|nr:hypothetical protein CPB83DRAFT_855341 [Crepidotus variabilis]